MGTITGQGRTATSTGFWNRRTLAQGWIWSVVPWLIALGLSIDTTRLIWHNDVFVHVRMGLDIITNGRFSGDPNWTYGPSDPNYMSPMPGSQVLIAAVYNALGWSGIAALTGILAAVLAGTLWWAFTQLSPDGTKTNVSPTRVAVPIYLSIIFMITLYGIDPRPQLFSLILLPIVGVWAVRIVAEGIFPKPWLVFPFTLIWVWLHGYALLVAPILGLATLAYLLGTPPKNWLHLLKQTIIPALSAICAAFLATLLTPQGFHIYSTSLDIRQVSVPLLTEWSPAPWGTPFTWLIFLIILAWMMAALFTFKKRNLKEQDKINLIREGLFVLAITLATVPMQRTLPIAYLLLGLVLGYRWMHIVKPNQGKPWEKWEPSTAARASGIIAVLTALILYGAFWTTTHPDRQGLDQNKLPLTLFAQVTTSLPPGQERYLIADWDVATAAGMLIPNVKVAVDGRIDRYGITGAYDIQKTLLNKEPGWESILARYPATTDILLKTSRPLYKELIDKGWKVLTEDPSGGYIWLISPTTT